MNPASSSPNVVHSGRSHAVLRCYDRGSKHSKECSHFQRLFGCKTMISRRLSVASPFGIHVADVVSLSADKKMIRTNTRSNVTAMQDVKPFGDSRSRSEFYGDSVSGDRIGRTPHQSVARIPGDRSYPQPTRIGIVGPLNPSPEPTLQRFQGLFPTGAATERTKSRPRPTSSNSFIHGDKYHSAGLATTRVPIRSH